MKKYNLLCLLLSLLLMGCIHVDSTEYNFDYKTGTLEVVYHNIYSAGDAAEYQQDWAEVSKISNYGREQGYNEKLIPSVSRELFQEDAVLSGREIFQVRCPECFPAKSSLLQEIIAAEEAKIETINNEILIFFSKEAVKNVSSNGKVLETDSNFIVGWPEDAERFELKIESLKDEAEENVKSFLPLYLEEKTQSEK